MKLPMLLLSLALLNGCATIQERRCSALQDELSESTDPCNRCRARLTNSEHPEDAALCQYVCAHPGMVAPAVVAACTPQLPAPATPPASEVPPDAAADSSIP